MTSPTHFTAFDQRRMQRALELAAQGRYTTTPNPRVGCVIVANDRVVGEGWHRRAGEAHAEVEALAQAGGQARGATAYVTLEPCSFIGKTGPCTEALITAGISRVIYAVGDPNPKVSGQGARKLESAGIVVDSGLCQVESEQLNRGFFKRMRQQLPYVTAKMASSLDGRTAMASGESQWITGSEARRAVQAMRASSCALVTGVGTVLQDDPMLTVREQQLGEPVERQPALVVVDTELRTPLNASVISASVKNQRRVIMACGEHIGARQMEVFKSRSIEVWPLPCTADSGLCLQSLLQKLGEQAFNEVMVEAGARLLGGFLQRQLLDELVLFMAPKLLGSGARPLLELPLQQMEHAVKLDISSVEPVGGDWQFNCRPRYN